MEEIISKEELENLKKIRGEVKGMGMKTHVDFVRKKEGEKGVKKLEEAMRELGHPIEYKKLKALGLYPLWWEALTLRVMQELFRYDDEKFVEVGEFHAKDSVVIRVFVKYFISIESVAKNISKVWEKYFTEPGEFTVEEFDKEKKSAVFRIKGFDFHPLHCQINRGIFSALTELLTKSRSVVCQETKCVYKGDEYDEFLVTW
jgi:predicted hydrocarbon binding protein